MFNNRQRSSRFSRKFSQNSYFRADLARNRPQFRGRPRRGESIDVSRFICKSTGQATEPVVIKNVFTDFAFSPALQKNILKRNYVTPTPIQDQAINHILEGRDLIGLADTGTGKTAAFLLPLIDKVFRNRRERVLIITPTRELAQQVEAEFRQFAWDMGIFSCSCVGGLPIYRQISALRREPSFVIGTPGRLKDLSKRNAINYKNFNTIVLDEVDRMLDMGFIDEITFILGQLPKEKQSLFFSATIPDKIKGLINSVLSNPVTIEVEPGDAAGNIDQDIIRVAHRGEKLSELTKLLAKPETEKVLIFSETKRDVEKLTDDLVQRGFKAESIHGNKKQHQRQRALAQFRDNSIAILVATDVAARGLDVKDITHVINYTLPQTYNDYIHRIGRTGRGNAKGFALTFVD